MSMCFLLDELFFISSIFIDHLFSQGDIMSDRCKLLSTKMDNPINLGVVDQWSQPRQHPNFLLVLLEFSFFFGFVLAYIFAYYKLYDVDYLTRLDGKLEIYQKDGKRTLREKFDR